MLFKVTVSFNSAILLIRSIFLVFFRSFIFLFKLFSVKGQGEGGEQNQHGIEDNEQHGGEGGNYK